MKHLLLLFTLFSIAACGDKPAESSQPEVKAGGRTQLRDAAMSQLSKAEVTTKLAEAKMTLRVVAQADPKSPEAEALKVKIAELEQQLAALK